MTTNLSSLTNILFDDNARIDEKDDAIIALGGLADIRAIDVLMEIAADESQDYVLKSSAGESIARIMIDLNYLDKKIIDNLSGEAKDEAVNLLRAKKPEWKQRLDS